MSLLRGTVACACLLLWVPICVLSINIWWQSIRRQSSPLARCLFHAVPDRIHTWYSCSRWGHPAPSGNASFVDAMAVDDANTLSTAEQTDPFIPTYSDGTRIKWDGNYAHIDAALYEVGRHYKRAGLFQLFFKHRAVALSNGRIAVESFNSVWFTFGKVSDELPGGKKAQRKHVRLASTGFVMVDDTDARLSPSIKFGAAGVRTRKVQRSRSAVSVHDGAVIPNLTWWSRNISPREGRVRRVMVCVCV